MRSGPIVFCATGVEWTPGGIAAANRNIRAALAAVARDVGRPLETLALHEAPRGDPAYRTFSGRTVSFATAVYAGAYRASLMVFDHVHLAAPAMLVPGALRAPIVICAHGSEAAKRVRRSSIRAFKAADAVLTNSAYTLNKMRAFVDSFNGVACPLGLPPQHALSVAPPTQTFGGLSLRAADGAVRYLGPRTMLIVGRLDAGEREKGHCELIDTMPALIQRVPAAQLVIAGGGSDEVELGERAARSTAASAIFLTGPVEHYLLQRLYAACYAYVMPSRQEGFGLVYLEAMNFAKPCVACRGDGGAEVVVDAETGLLVDQPIDGAELVVTLARLLGDEDLARRMGLAGWRRLHEHFTSHAHQERVAAAVCQVLVGRCGAAVAPMGWPPRTGP